MPEREDFVDRIKQQLQEEKVFNEEDIEECIDLLEEREQRTVADRESVQLNRILAKQFKAIETERDVSLNQNDVVISGPNTSGKTSLVEAIRFNLLGRQQHQRITLVDPVTEGYDTLYTDGFWQVNGDEYHIHRELSEEGQGYANHDRPKITQNPDGRDVSLAARDEQRDVSELIGLWPYEARDFGRYNMFSLFFLDSEDAKGFVGWQDKTTFLDLLFGLDLTKVIQASEARRANRYDPSDEEKTAPQELKTAEDRLQELEDTVESLQEQRDEKQAGLNQRQEELNSVRDVLSGENELEQLRAEKARLNRRINSLRSERLDKRDELRQARQQISRYQESELSREIEPLAADLREIMSLPDRCPICTNDITSEQARRLIDHGDCPLCDKEVPEERIEIGSETDAEERVLEQQERREEIDRLQSREQELEGDIRILEEQVNDLEEQLRRVEEQIEETDLIEYADRRDRLEEEVADLEREATSIQVELNAREEELEEVRERVKELRKLKEQYDRKSHKQQMLQSFEKLVTAEIDYERGNIHEELEAIMEDLLDYFTEGLFASSTGVSFNSESSYEFTIYRSVGENKPSSRPNSDSVEGLIQSLLFQTAVLKYLDSLDGSLPIRLFVVDSPYAKEPDGGNAEDITSFVSQLPTELESYQIIVTMATTSLAALDEYEDTYDMLDF
jgi:chromosome segregation ATPase